MVEKSTPLQNFGSGVYTLNILAQVALRAPPEVALQCVTGHCYYHRSVFLSFFSLFATLGQEERPVGKVHSGLYYHDPSGRPAIHPAIHPMPMMKNYYFSLADLYSAYSFLGKEEKRK